MYKILVIEDDINSLLFIEEVLTIEKYEFCGVKSGLEAIEVVNKFMPDLIVCDIMMPDMDGYEVFNKIKQISPLKNIPFIFITALSTKKDLRKGMDLGADDYITKPFTSEQLISSIQTRLSKKKDEMEGFEKEIKSLQKNISTSIPQELLSPLNNILGIGNLMQTKFREISYDDIEKFGIEINKYGGKLLNIIKKFIFYTEVELMFSDSEQKKKLLNGITIWPEKIILSIANEISERYNRINDFILNIENSNLQIDETHFRILIHELIDNAFKFSESGDIVEVKLTSKDSYAELSICNKGNPISVENQNKIGAFRQFNKDIYDQEGIGLGLTIVKRLIEFYEGELGFENTDNSFVKVSIRLKIDDA